MKLKPFFTIGKEERGNVLKSLRKPLSGYLGGVRKAGYWIEKLEHNWSNEFEVEHAIACNSATSGLLAACMACGIGTGDTVFVTSYSMSATAACAAVLGAHLRFIDIEGVSFGLDTFTMPLGGEKPKAIIVTNLFGGPARDLTILAEYCRRSGIFLIEDNAQSPFAMIDGRYTGTIGDIGVFSLNVHKHIQAGEGGVIVTRNPALAEACFDAVNHGELRGGRPGLNLRMTEPTAAIACAQLRRAHGIIGRKIDLGETLTDAVRPFATRIYPPNHGKKYRHVYYCWAAICGSENVAHRFASGLAKAGLPARKGYAPNLVDIFQTGDLVPSSRDIDSRVVVVDLCQIDPSPRQVVKLGILAKEAADEAVC